MFRKGREDVEIAERSGRPSTLKGARVKSLLDRDCRLSIRMISDKLGISKSDVHELVGENMGMRKVCAKLVPRVLLEAPSHLRCPLSCRVLQPSYGSDVDPPDFIFFHHLKSWLKGRHHASMEVLQQVATRELSSIPGATF